MTGSTGKQFAIVFGVGAAVGVLTSLAMQPHPLAASVNNLNGQKFNELINQVDLLKTEVNSLKTNVDLQGDLLSGFSRGGDGSLRIADKTRMVELLVECPAESNSENPGLKVCGPAVFESSRMDASRVVLNGNGDFDPAVLVMIPDLPMPRSAMETIGGNVSFLNSRVRIAADETLDGEDPLFDVSINNWNLLSDNPLVSVRGGDLSVASGPDQGTVTIAPGQITAVSPLGSQALIGVQQSFAKIELLVKTNGDGPIVSHALMQANGGEEPRSSLNTDDVAADYIFGRQIQGFDITEIGGTDGGPF